MSDGKIWESVYKMKPRTNYDKVITLLYKAMYSVYQLTYKDLKIIIDYIMKEYIWKVGN